MKTKKTFDICISIVVAILLWAYVLNVVNPPSNTTIRDVPVQLLHQDSLASNKLAIAGDGYYTVDVVVKGARSGLSNINEDYLTATADLTGLSAGQNYITVNVECSASDVTVEEVRSQKIQVYIDEFVEVEKPLNVAYGELDGDYEVSLFTTEAENIVVSGAKSLVDLVTEVRVDVDTSILETDKYVKQKLTGVPLDAEGNIVQAVKLSREEVSVTLTRLAVKEVPLKVKTTGIPGLNAEVASVSAPGTVKITGLTSALNPISSISAETINIEGITSNKTYNLKLNLPSGIELAAAQEPVSATVKLADMASSQFDYSISDVAFLNLDDGLAVRILGEQDENGNEITTEIISVYINGNLSTVRDLTPSLVSPALDLTGIGEGELKLALTSVYSGNDISIEVDPAYLNVEVSALPEEPVEEETTEE